MVDVLVHFRSPFYPHHEVAVQEVSKLKYGFQLNRPGRGSFSVSRATPNSAQFLGLGMFITIERSDSFLPWGGFITQRSYNLAGAMVDMVAEDHAGAIFPHARTAKDWLEVDQPAGEHIRSVFRECDARAEPPLQLDLPSTAGPPVSFTPKAESLITFLRTMTRVTDWEWGLRYDCDGICRPALIWAERLGLDRRASVWFEDGIHFTAAKMTEKASGFIVTGMAVGGSGTFKDRPAEAVTSGATSGGTLPSKTGASTTGSVRTSLLGRRRSFRAANISQRSPAISGTRVLVEHQVTNRGALRAAAVRLHVAPENVGESMEFSFAETDFDMGRLELGSRYSVRFHDLALGLAVEREFRLRSLTLGQDGIVAIVADLDAPEAKDVQVRA